MWTMLRFLRLSLLLSFVLPCGFAEAWTANEWLGVIEASVGAVTATSVSPDVTPSNGECENCSGTGKVGDGTVFVICPVCDGTGTNEKGDSAANAATTFQVCTAFR